MAKWFKDGQQQIYFQAVSQSHHAEQAHYWSRFVAFSAISTGLFVLYSGSSPRLVVAMAGITTSVLWAMIQIKSLAYVDSHKDVFHQLYRELWINANDERKETGTLPELKRPISRSVFPWSTTKMGAFFAVIVFFVWSFLFGAELNKLLLKE